jgi:hypothetical protein
MYLASLAIIRPFTNFPRISLAIILMYMGFSQIKLTRLGSRMVNDLSMGLEDVVEDLFSNAMSLEQGNTKY